MRVLKLSASVLGVVVFASVATLSAQNSGNPSILAAVQAVQTSLNALATKVTSLVTTVNTINTNVTNIAASTGEANFLFTPTLVGFPPDTLICAATNVTSASRNVSVQLLNGNGGAVLASASGNLSPASTTNVTNVPGAAGIRAFCKITVNDGVKSDVRGVLSLYSAATASDKDPLPAF